MTSSPTRTGKKYAVRAQPPHSDQPWAPPGRATRRGGKSLKKGIGHLDGAKPTFSLSFYNIWSFVPGDRTKNSLIFKRLFANFALRDPLGGRSRRALHFENMQYRIGFIDVFDALIESMLDHRTVTKK